MRTQSTIVTLCHHQPRTRWHMSSLVRGGAIAHVCASASVALVRQDSFTPSSERRTKRSRIPFVLPAKGSGHGHVISTTPSRLPSRCAWLLITRLSFVCWCNAVCRHPTLPPTGVATYPRQALVDGSKRGVYQSKNACHRAPTPPSHPSIICSTTNLVIGRPTPKDTLSCAGFLGRFASSFADPGVAMR
jgi:hypothetical protein